MGFRVIGLLRTAAALAALFGIAGLARADYAEASAEGRVRLDWTIQGGDITVTTGNPDLPKPTFVGISDAGRVLSETKPTSDVSINEKFMTLGLGDIAVEFRPSPNKQTGLIVGLSDAKSYSLTFKNASTTSDATVSFAGEFEAYSYQLITNTVGKGFAAASFEAAIVGTGVPKIGRFEIGPGTAKKGDKVAFTTSIFVGMGETKTVQITGGLRVRAGVVPEPSSLALSGIGSLVGLGYLRARRRSAAGTPRDSEPGSGDSDCGLPDRLA